VEIYVLLTMEVGEFVGAGAGVGVGNVESGQFGIVVGRPQS